MKTILSAFILSALLHSVCVNAQVQFATERKISRQNNTRNNTIVVELHLPAQGQEMRVLQFSPVEIIGRRQWKSESQKPENGMTRWVINSEEATYLYTKSLFKSQKNTWFLAEPGDNISIHSEGEQLRFSGVGSEKFNLRFQIDSLLATIPRPGNPKDYRVISLEDYFEWHHYLNKQLELVVPLIDSYKGKISQYAYHFIRAGFIDQNIDNRSDKFGALLAYARNGVITQEDICAIYDSTYHPATEKWFQYASSQIYGNWRPIMYKIIRDYLFDRDYILKSEIKFKLLFYEAATTVYKGLIREKFIVDYFPEEFMQELGFIGETEKLLSQYYAEPGYDEYKRYIKNFELQERERRNGQNAPDFALTDLRGNSFTKKDLKNKIAVIDFWFTGCVGCVEMVPAMQRVEGFFKHDTNLVFLSVSIDKDSDEWKRSIAQKKYTTGNGLNLYTGGQGDEHEMIRQYAVDGYPVLWLIDPLGRLIRTYPKPDPRKNNGKGLIELLQKQLAYLKDGPYILHEPLVSTMYSVKGNSLLKVQFDRNDSPVLNVQTDQDRTFTVSLKKSLNIEPSEFPKPSRLLVLSDIEGNFDAFRKLLQANKVIDQNYHWIFGDGHLVFAGDMFDRGLQVTECLWLMYSLEEKAKAYGGYVHFILGNHEIMNLQGNDRYVQPKYSNNALQIGKNLKELYGENSELGRWLRSKNIVEKIGDLLFAHGGISREVASLPLSIQQINDFLRLNIDAKDGHITDSSFKVLLSTKLSPHWFRDYYEQGEEKDPRVLKVAELDAILAKFKVNHIVTGHTVVADSISVWHGGRIINTDTKHAEGKSEALMIEDDKYYRVNLKGVRTELLSVNANKSGYVIRD